MAGNLLPLVLVGGAFVVLSKKKKKKTKATTAVQPTSPYQPGQTRPPGPAPTPGQVRPPGSIGSPTRPDPQPAPAPTPSVGPEVTTGCDPLDPSTWGEGNICVMEGNQWVRVPKAAPQADTAGQVEVDALGYGGLFNEGYSLPLVIATFQADWNWFVDYIQHVNPDIEYDHPYTKIEEDGGWGPDTAERAAKAMVKFDGKDPVYVKELDADVATFHDMIRGLQTLNANA